MGATTLLAQMFHDEDGLPMQVWHASTSEWLDVFYTQVWNGSAWT